MLSLKDLVETGKERPIPNELPVHHSPLFAPAIHPTLQPGGETLIVAAQAWFSAQQTVD